MPADTPAKWIWSSNNSDHNTVYLRYTIEVAGNTAPVATNGSVTTDEDVPVGITLNASDADGDALTYAVVSGPAHGTLSGTAPTLTYTPNAGFFGSDSLTFKASDGQVDSNVATVSITVNEVVPPNTAPVAHNGAVTTDEDVAVAVTLTATDADGDALTYTVVTGPAHGTLSGTAPSLTYTPNSNVNGSDSFTFKANDGQADSNVATVTITINAVNDVPVIDTAASASPASLLVSESTTVSVAASDVDGDLLSCTWSKVSGPGTVTFGNAAAQTTTASFSAAGSYLLRATISDGTASVSSDVAVTVTEPVLATMHVQSITCATTPGAKGAKFASVTVVIVDRNDQPVAGATVSGSFGGDLSGSVTAVTDAKGTATFASTTAIKQLSYTFTVSGVSHPDMVYDPTANVETSDSY